MEKMKVIDLDSWLNEKDEVKPIEENKNYVTLYADGKPIGRHYVIDKEE